MELLCWWIVADAAAPDHETAGLRKAEGDVWADKVNRLKVNSSSCAGATRGARLWWRRRGDQPSDPVKQKNG